LKHEQATEEIRELAALYALSALTQHEAHSFEMHLAEGCPVCESELRIFEQTAAGFGLAAEEIETPGYVRDLLLARIEREPRVAAPSVPSTPNEDKPMPEPASPLFSTIDQPKSKKSMSKSVFWFLQGLMIVLIVLCAWFIYNLRSVQALNARLQTDLSRSQADAGDLRILLDIQKEKSEDLNQLLTVAGKPKVRMARLTSPSGAPSSSGALFLDPEQQHYLLIGSFPPPPPGKAYQLWLATPSVKVSAGLVKVNPANPTFTKAPVPSIASDAVAAGITLEPEGGSKEPTTSYFVLGRFN
jgi:hypothetical protein